MFKRISAIIIASAMLAGMVSCSMPQNIFSDDLGTTSQVEEKDYSKELFDFAFTLDDKNYFLPASYTYFVDRGWEFEPNDDQENANEDDTQEVTLAKGRYSGYHYVVNKGYRIGLKFYNDGDKEAALEDCKVVGISMDALADSVPFIRFLDHIEFGSSYDEIVELCGEPSFTKSVLQSNGELASINDIDFTDSEEKKTRKSYYYLNNHTFIEFTFGIYNRVSDSVVNIVMENNVDPEKSYNYKKDRKKAPDVISLYKQPALLGKTLSDFSFKYDDNLYTLPIPVSELIDDGWSFMRGASMKVQRGTTQKGVVLKKGNMFVDVLVHNYDTKKVQTPINCYAVSLSAGVTGPFVNVMMPKGITLGSDLSKVETFYGVPAEDDEDNNGANDNSENNKKRGYAVSNDKNFVESKETDDYIKYSYIMPDDVPTVELPVSITDVGDVNKKLLGTYRKRIDIYVSKVNNKVVHIYMQNCPEYVVDEAALWAEQLEKADREKNK